jgi:Lrp/AsnC family transcriptional regulator, leucine-responsive regulatory protein
VDAIDRTILSVLQEDGRISNAALAERVRLSASPCLRRLRRLEDDGIIVGYRAVLSRPQLGLGLTVFVELKVEGHSRRVADEMSDALAAIPEVVSAHIVSGSADFLAEVVVRDLPHYERLLLDTLLELPGVIDARSNFAMRAIKTSGPLPLPPADAA